VSGSGAPFFVGLENRNGTLEPAVGLQRWVSPNFIRKSGWLIRLFQPNSLLENSPAAARWKTTHLWMIFPFETSISIHF
jgi:hypothetical protein